MILYFANRKFDIIGQASTEMREGFIVFDDLKTEEIETGVASFECYIGFDKSNRLLLQDMTQAGNYLLRKNDGENEFYTIIDTEIDTKEQKIYIYAEDAGLDLLNEEAPAYEATETHTAEWYVNKYITDSGFEIGINEIPNDRTRKLSWSGSSNVTERIASIANSFGGFEVSYSFEVVGMEVTHKYINLYEERGKDVGEQLRLNRELDRIVIKQSIANVATALRVEGGTPENSSSPITLKGYKYDDGDFWVGSNGLLYSREAVDAWSRYNWEKKNPGWEGHIVKSFSYDTTSQSTLLSKAIAHLKKVREVETNYEVDINELPDNIKIGDRVNIVDDAGELYLSTRLLVLEKSVANRTQKATLGEYLIKASGISEKVMELAEQFSDIAANRQFYIWTAYADDDNGTGISLDPNDKEYLGTAVNQTSEQVDISDPSIFTWVKVKGDKGDQGIQGSQGIQGPKGDQGIQGAKGSTGNGIKSIVNYYLATASASGITTSTSGWTISVQNVSASKKYLWNYEVITYTNGTTSTSTPCIIGAYGDKGATGATGPKGDQGVQGPKGDNGVDGIGILNIADYYLASTLSSGITINTSGWSSTPQSMTVTNRYLWHYQVITYTDNSTKTILPVIIGVYGATGPKGDTGATGNTGATGATGKGIKSVTPQYYLSSSNTNQTGSSWKTTQDTWASGKYYWTRDKIVWDDNSTTYTTPVLATGLNNANSIANTAKSTADQTQKDTNALEKRVGNAEKSIIDNADSIELRVKKDEIISSINQSAEKVQIKANKIQFEGLVTANNNFKILEDGSIETVNGKFSGMINAESGTIGGWQVNEYNIYTENIYSMNEEDDTKFITFMNAGGSITFTRQEKSVKNPNEWFTIAEMQLDGEKGLWYGYFENSEAGNIGSPIKETYLSPEGLQFIHKGIDSSRYSTDGFRLMNNLNYMNGYFDNEDITFKFDTDLGLIIQTSIGGRVLFNPQDSEQYIGCMYIDTPNYVRIGGGGDVTANKLYLYEDKANFNGTDFRISNTRLPYKTTSVTVKIGAHSANGIDSKTVTVSNAVEIAGWNANGTGSSGLVLNRISCSGSSLYLEFRCIIATDSTTEVVVYYRNY